MNCTRGWGGDEGELREGGIKGNAEKVWLEPELQLNVLEDGGRFISRDERYPIHCTRPQRVVTIVLSDIGNEVKNGNRRCEDQPHNFRASGPLRLPNLESGVMEAARSAPAAR